MISRILLYRNIIGPYNNIMFHYATPVLLEYYCLLLGKKYHNNILY